MNSPQAQHEVTECGSHPSSLQNHQTVNLESTPIPTSALHPSVFYPSINVKCEKWFCPVEPSLPPLLLFQVCLLFFRLSPQKEHSFPTDASVAAAAAAAAAEGGAGLFLSFRRRYTTDTPPNSACRQHNICSVTLRWKSY